MTRKAQPLVPIGIPDDNRADGYRQQAGGRTGITPGLLFLAIFSIYLALRCFAWKNTVLLEDTDSLSYLKTIKVFLTCDLQQIVDLDPDSSLFYSFFGALFSLPGWSVESGARLCSLVFSAVLFVAILGIGRQMAQPLEIALGLLVLSFSPVLIPFSFSVLTEPSYVATVYLGFWLFWTQCKDPRLWKAGLLGVIYGLSFLNRVEGILHLVVIPLLQGAYAYWEGRKSHSDGLKRFMGWSLVFGVCFSLIATPQIWRVSRKMDTLAINGRQAWAVLLSNPDGKSYDEKIHGLDFSPSQTNIRYVKGHPEAIEQLELSTSRYLSIIVRNFIKHLSVDLYQEKLGTLIGPLGLVFFASGILTLYRLRRFESFLVLAFIASNLVAPLVYGVDVKTRFVAVIAPAMMLVEGIGIAYLSRSLLESHRNYPLGRHILPFVLLLALVGASAYPLARTGGVFRPRVYNREYGPAELEKPVAIVKEITENELLRTPVIAAQRGYLAYFAEGKHLYLPYTDYEGLVRYCDLNHVDFLYLKHKRVECYPFLESFLKGSSPPDFVLLYRGVDAYGEGLELYRFQN